MTTYTNFLSSNLRRAYGSVSGAVINIDKDGSPNIVKFENLRDLEKGLDILNQKSLQTSLER